MAAKNWIAGALKHPGALTKKANAAHMGVQSFAQKMEHAAGKTGQQARLAMTLNKLHKAAHGVRSISNQDKLIPEPGGRKPPMVPTQTKKRVLRDGKELHGMGDKPIVEAADGAVVEVESADAHQKEVDQGKEGEPPLDLNTSEPNMVLVGDGGSDPAAEEYLYLPEGSQAIVAPKSHPDETPSMPNAVKAIANIQLKKAAGGLKRAAVGISSSATPTPIMANGRIAGYYDPNGSLIPGQISPEGHVLTWVPNPNAQQSTSTPKPAPTGPVGYASGPATPVPTVAPTPTQSPAPAPSQNYGPATPAAPYDPGVGVEPAKPSASLTPSTGMASTIENTMPNSVTSGQFGRSARNILLGAAHGMIRDMVLKRAATGMTKQPVLSPGGMVVGYQSVQDTGYGSPTQSASTAMTDYQKQQLALQKQQLGMQANANTITPYQQAQLDLQRQQLASQNQLSPNTTYQTDAQKWIAEQNIQAQAAQNAATLQYNRERLALDKLLGERQATTDENRAREEAMNMLATRAGRQLIAPGGSVIPSMQPVLGRSIN